MRKLFVLIATAAMFFAGGCSDEYDDTALTGRVDNLENRVAKLEELCRQMNTNISALQTIVTALANVYCVAVTPPKTGIGTGDPFINTLRTQLFVPKGSAEAYKKAGVWTEFKTITEQ